MGAPPPVTVVGAGLAGCEAAVALARRGVPVELLEMKPAERSPAHTLPGPAELVCSNSLKSDDPGTAHGLLKEELRRLGSVVLAAADETRVPAGTALAVDRRAFSEAVERRLRAEPLVRLVGARRVDTPPPGDVLLATGPLTGGGLTGWLAERLGPGSQLYFVDALAPIVEADSLDRSRVFAASRWGKGGDDYLNCPLDEAQYRRLVEALRQAPGVEPHPFESPRYFEGCMPVEVLAGRGQDALAFGPLRPVGLEFEGRRPYAVVQLRPENRERSAFNLVGFQTKLTQAAQREVFRMIPGLEGVRFLRYGAVHRNLYVHAPAVLDDALRLRVEPRVRLAGQMTGVEGYVESAAIGLLAGWTIAAERSGARLSPPPAECALGALAAHLRGRPGAPAFEPNNIHFGLLPAPDIRNRAQRRQAVVERARSALGAWLAAAPLA